MVFKFSLHHTKILLVILALVALLVVVWAMVGRLGPPNDGSQPVTEVQTATDGADAVLKDFVYTSTDNRGVLQWRLNADTATHYKEKNLIELADLKITFFTDQGPTYTVTAAKGVVNTQTQDFDISGNVTGVSDDGLRFRTESFRYQADIQEARTDARAFLESPRFNLEGRGMIIDVQNRKVSLLHDVQATGKQ